MRGIKEIAPTLNLDMLDVESIINYVVSNTNLSENHPLRRMIRFVSNMLWFRNLDQNRYIGYKTNSKDYYNFIFEDENLAELEDLLHSASIEDKLISLIDNDGKQKLYFQTDNPLPFFSVASSGIVAIYLLLLVQNCSRCIIDVY